MLRTLRLALSDARRGITADEVTVTLCSSFLYSHSGSFIISAVRTKDIVILRIESYDK